VARRRNWLWRDEGRCDTGVDIAADIRLSNRSDFMAPPRTGAKSLHIRVLPGQMGDLDAWIDAQPGPRLLRVEAVRRLLTERLAGEPAPAPAAPIAEPPSAFAEREAEHTRDVEQAELRRELIRLGGKIDQLVAYARRVEAERDALAARAPRLEVVRQSPRELPGVAVRGSALRSDPEAVARARAQLAEAEARDAATAEAERRRRGDSSTSSGGAPRD
jgi:hypothetical protein